MSRRRYIPPGLLAHWVFDGSPGHQRGTIKDLSGNARDLTVYGRPCLSFDGAGDSVSVELADAFPAAGQTRTITAWVYPTGVGCIARTSEDSIEQALYLAADGADIRLYYRCAGTPIAGPVVPAGSWTFVRLTVTLGELVEAGESYQCDAALSWRLNEASATNSTTTADTAGPPLTSLSTIGSDATVGDLAARLRDVAIWSRALTDAEGRALYDYPAHFATGAAWVAAALMEGWLVNEGTGSTITGVGSTEGTIIGATWSAAANGGQSWKRAAGTAGDAFQAGSREFRGSNDEYAAYAGSLPLRAQTDAFTIVAWYQYAGSASGYVTCNSGGSTTGLYHSVASGPSMYCGTTGTSAGIGATTAPVCVAMAVPAASEGAIIYVNGVAKATGNIAAAGAVTGIAIGNKHDATRNYPLKGSVREVMLFGRMLSASELLSLYEQGVR